MWPYLEGGSLQRSSVRWGHTRVGWSPNPKWPCLWTQAWAHGERHVKVKAEVTANGPQTREWQRLPETTRSEERSLEQTPHCSLRGSQPCGHHGLRLSAPEQRWYPPQAVESHWHGPRTPPRGGRRWEKSSSGWHFSYSLDLTRTYQKQQGGQVREISGLHKLPPHYCHFLSFI